MAQDPALPGEADLAGARRGHLGELCREAGLAEVVEGTVSVSMGIGSVQEWWTPYTLGVGPAGSYVATLDDAARTRLRDACAERLPPPPFRQDALAWAVRATCASP